jgi:hypothetical protein
VDRSLNVDGDKRSWRCESNIEVLPIAELADRQPFLIGAFDTDEALALAENYRVFRL